MLLYSVLVKVTAHPSVPIQASSGTLSINSSPPIRFSVREASNMCTYDSVSHVPLTPRGPAYDVAHTSGAFIGDVTDYPDQKCIAHRGRGLKQAVVRRGVPDKNVNKRGAAPGSKVGWTHRGSLSQGPKHDLVPSSTSNWCPHTSPPLSEPLYSSAPNVL